MAKTLEIEIKSNFEKFIQDIDKLESKAKDISVEPKLDDRKLKDLPVKEWDIGIAVDDSELKATQKKINDIDKEKIDVEVDVDDSELKNLGDTVEKEKGKIDSGGGLFSGLLAGAGAFAAGGLLVEGIGTVVSAAGEGVSKLYELANRADELGTLMENGFRLAGLSGQELTDQIASSEKAARKLGFSIGVAPERLKELAATAGSLGGATGKTNEDLTKLAIGIEKATDGSIKGEDAIKIFSRGLTDPANAEAIDKLKKNFPQLGEALLKGTTPAEKLKAGLDALEPTFTTLRNDTTDAAARFGIFQDVASEAAQSFGGAILSSFNTDAIFPDFSEVGEGLFTALAEAGTFVGEAFTEIFGKIVTVVKTLQPFIEPIVTLIGGALVSAFVLAKEVVSNALDIIIDVFTAVADAIQPAIDGISSFYDTFGGGAGIIGTISSYFSALFESIKNGASIIIDALAKPLKTVFSVFGDLYKTIADVISIFIDLGGSSKTVGASFSDFFDIVTAIGEVLVTFISGSINFAVNIFKTLADVVFGIVKYFTSFADTSKKTGKTTEEFGQKLSGLKEILINIQAGAKGVTAVITFLQESITKFITLLVSGDFLKAFKVFDNIGGNIAKSFNKAFDETKKTAIDKALATNEEIAETTDIATEATLENTDAVKANAEANVELGKALEERKKAIALFIDAQNKLYLEFQNNSKDAIKSASEFQSKIEDLTKTTKGIKTSIEVEGKTVIDEEEAISQAIKIKDEINATFAKNEIEIRLKLSSLTEANKDAEEFVNQLKALAVTSVNVKGKVEKVEFTSKALTDLEKQKSDLLANTEIEPTLRAEKLLEINKSIQKELLENAKFDAKQRQELLDIQAQKQVILTDKTEKKRADITKEVQAEINTAFADTDKQNEKLTKDKEERQKKLTDLNISLIQDASVREFTIAKNALDAKSKEDLKLAGNDAILKLKIQEKYQLDLATLEKKYFGKSGTAGLLGALTGLSSALDEAFESNGLNEFVEKQEEAKKAIDETNKAIDEQVNELQNSLKDQTLAYNDYVDKVVELEQQKTDKLAGLQDKQDSKLKQITASAISYVSKYSDALSASIKSYEEIQEKQDERAEKIESLEELEQRSAAQTEELTELRAESEQSGLETTQAVLGATKEAFSENTVAYKALAIAEATIATYLGAAKAIGTGGFLGIAQAVIVIAAGLANVAKIAEIGFKTGGYTGDLGTNDVAGVVHGKEFVVNADATKGNLPFLQEFMKTQNPVLALENLNMLSNDKPTFDFVMLKNDNYDARLGKIEQMVQQPHLITVEGKHRFSHELNSVVKGNDISLVLTKTTRNKIRRG